MQGPEAALTSLSLEGASVAGSTGKDESLPQGGYQGQNEQGFRCYSRGARGLGASMAVTGVMLGYVHIE